MLYERFISLCRVIGLEPTKAALLAGFSSGTPSYWKKQKNSDMRIGSGTIARLANFFMVNPGYFVGETNSYKSGMAYKIMTDHYPSHLTDIICDNLSQLIKLGKFKDNTKEFIEEDILKKKSLPSIEELGFLCDEAGVTLSYLFGPYSYCLHGKEERENDVRVALFGGDVDVTDEMWAEAKAYAALIVARQKNQKGS